MAQGTAPSVQEAGRVSERLARAEQLIDQRLEETRKRVKTTDMAVSLFLLALGVCAYLLGAAMVDHWTMPLAQSLDRFLLPEGTRGLSGLLPALGLFEQPPPLGAGGLSAGGRLVLWLVLVVAVAAIVVRRLLPVVLFRINPVFAAYTIEQSRPSLKNSLINLLFLRREREEIARDELARRVFEGLEFRTAGELAQVSPDTAVDRSSLIHLGYALVSVVALLCLYLIFSPKNPIVSMRRVMWPWAELQAPTRVTIRQVSPGDTLAYQGDTLVVSAEVRGLKTDESPILYFTTADRQTVGEAVPMAPAGTYRFQCELPPGKLGLSQNLEYFVSAGDAITRTYSVEVQVPLSIAVERIEYQYPAYTGKAPETVEGTGDLKALEGTEVTLRARANQPIEKATIEMNCDPRNARRMESRGQSAQVAFFLRMHPQEPTQPEYTSYQLRFVDPQGRENRRPIRYRIEVVPDLPPEIRIVTDLPDEIRLPRNGHLDVVLRAEDPDFGLRKVGIRARCQEKTLPVPPLLDLPRYEKAHRGPLEGACRIEPARLGLQVGDKVVFWGEAEDNRELAAGPAPNRAETEKRIIIIVPDEAPPKPPAGRPAGGEKPDKGPRSPDQLQQPGQAAPPDQPRAPEQPGGQEQPQPSAKPPQDAQQPPELKPQTADAETKPQSHDGGAADNVRQQPGASDEGQAEGQAPAGQPSAESEPGQQEGKPAKPSAGQKKPSGADQQPSETGQESSPAQKPSVADGPQPPGGSQRPRQPVNSRTNPGDAIEEILRHQQQHAHEQAGPARQEAQGSEAESGTQRQPAQEPMPAGQAPQPEEPGRPQQQPGQAPAQRPAEGSQSQGETLATQPSAEEKPGGGEKPSSGQPPGPGQRPAAGQESAGGKRPGSTEKPVPAKPSAASEPTPGEKPAGPTKPEEGSKASPSQAIPAAEKPQPSVGGKPEPSGPEKPGPSAAEKPTPAAPEKPKPSGPENPGMPQGVPGTEGTRLPKEPTAVLKPGTGETPQREETAAPGSKPGDEKPTARSQPHPPGCQCESCKAGGGGKAGQSPQASPLPQEANQPRPGQAKPAVSPTPEEAPSPDTAQSPSTSPKQSKSEGQESGDRSGGGKQGGGQGAQEQGPGMAGSQTDAEEGAGASPQAGQGPTGPKPGEQASAGQSPGKPAADQPGQGGQTSAQPLSKPADDSGKGLVEPADRKPLGQPQADGPSGSPPSPAGDSGAIAQKPGGTPGGKSGGGAQNPQGGGLPGKGEAPPPAEPTKPHADDPILEYTRKQTNLALRHLEEEANKGRSDLLERLGWTPEQAREFIEWYRRLEQAATSPSPEGQAARRERDAWLKSLGLRPHGTELRGGSTPRDKLQNLKDPGRIPPPPKWRSQFRAFTEGLGSQRP